MTKNAFESDDLKKKNLSGLVASTSRSNYTSEVLAV